MGRSEEYRRFAEECLKIARTATAEETRATFMQMAQVWFRLSAEKEVDRDEGDDTTI